MKKAIRRTSIILAAAVIASTGLLATPGSATTDKSDSITIPISKTPGGNAMVLGKNVYIPKSFSGTATLSYRVQGQRADVIASEAAAADDCLDDSFVPVLGIDFLAKGGELWAQLTLTGTVQSADGSTVPYSQAPVAAEQKLGAADQSVEVFALCLEEF